MGYEEFKKVLKNNKLTLKEFSKLSGVSYGTSTKWGKDNRPVSDWVESWLTLYVENQRLKVLENMIKEMCERSNHK